MPKKIAPRFGIGEWYGHSFVRLTPEQRVEYAKKAREQTIEFAPPCPFVSETVIRPCNKKGGICSLRLYERLEDGSAQPLSGDAGKLRITCPRRFKQSNTVFSQVAATMIGTDTPEIISEVRFLIRPLVAENIDVEDTSESTRQKSDDVGNIDIVLVNRTSAEFLWCALEIQAVYFSGQGMSSLFNHIEAFAGPGIPFPDKNRRPDYRSSGPKRLMPQLQIKVPTLRRWGKKMAAVVDVPWFRTNVVGVETVRDISNCDIAWFLVDFDETSDPAILLIREPVLQTLERAVEGLTGGSPVTLSEFELKIREKMAKNQ